ncbi:cutinase family protein [Nocardia brasiliensis]|uniref:cutinase family protein n=1 Tax=Nocardia brasiliensis TaxID=37326 RepID=UPI0018943092|nr:cutinase family protein [Nocardia brasiliensis]MBF6545284.1 cutinase family protein [Nocardia brasiliensis]
MRNNHNRRSTRHLARIAMCAAVVATAVGGGVAAADPTSDRIGGQCPRWTALLAPGTYKTTPAPGQAPVGILDQVGQSLTARYGSDIEVRTLPAPTTGTGTTSRQELTTALSGLCSNTRVVLAGYAQGAEVAGDLAAAIGHGQGPIPASRVVAVALVSDPRRDPATGQLGPAVPGQGVTGPRAQSFGEVTDRVRTLCAEGDPYCSTTPETSPVLTAVSRALAASAPPSATPIPTPDSSTTAAPPPTASTPDLRTGSASTGQLSVSQILAQVITALNGLSSFTANVPAIVADLAALPGLLTSGDVRGLRGVCGDLNNRFNPLVQLVAGLDLRLIARALAMAAPLDTTGVATIAAEIVSVLAGLDITRIATAIGRAQEIVWTAVETLTSGDPLAALLALSGLTPIAAELLSATAAAFTGTRLPMVAQTYTTGTGTSGTAKPARNGGTTGFSASGYDSAAAVLAHWIAQAIDHAK